MTDFIYENTEPMGAEDHGLVEAVVCGTLMLGAPSAVALLLIVVLVFVGVRPDTIEKAMVWLSVPWFAMCYVLCRVSHGTKAE